MRQTGKARRHGGTEARRRGACAPSALRAFARTCLCAFALLAVAGCHSAKVTEPITGSVGGNDPGEQVEFWHRLAERPVTSNDDAFHGLLLFLDGEDRANDYAGRVAELKRRKMLPGGFDRAAETRSSGG